MKPSDKNQTISGEVASTDSVPAAHNAPSHAPCPSGETADGTAKATASEGGDHSSRSASRIPLLRYPQLFANFIPLILHQAIFRIAWIFKTESVVIPAFLDTIADSGLARGVLPLINRTAQSVSPLLLSQQISDSRLKSRWLLFSTLLMALPFLVIGGSVFLLPTPLPGWFTSVFFLLYAVFFCFHGVNEISFSTVVGKLIPAERRGRLTALSASCGSFVAVILAWWLMGRWLNDPAGRPFGRIFLFVGSGMLLSVVVLLWLKEEPDSARPARRSGTRHFRDAYQRIRDDAVLRRLCVFSSLFVFSQILFPHYQRLGLSQSESSVQLLMVWVVAQHIGASVFSWISGHLADRYGNRSALRFLTVAGAAAPILSLALAGWLPVQWYFVTFFWLGLVPVTFRIQSNYALEITDRTRHPAYISTMRLCMAVPFLLSPGVGWLIDRAGFQLPFLMVSAILAAAAAMTWFMYEPRDHATC
ncbi:MAG: MFS transporter [Planctomycetaceae bacterium]|nr:MFS transporter [Planctomycetaceae bacterium]